MGFKHREERIFDDLRGQAQARRLGMIVSVFIQLYTTVAMSTSASKILN